MDNWELQKDRELRLGWNHREQKSCCGRPWARVCRRPDTPREPAWRPVLYMAAEERGIGSPEKGWEQGLESPLKRIHKGQENLFVYWDFQLDFWVTFVCDLDRGPSYISSMDQWAESQGDPSWGRKLREGVLVGPFLNTRGHTGGSRILQYCAIRKGIVRSSIYSWAGPSWNFCHWLAIDLLCEMKAIALLWKVFCNLCT